MRKGILGLSSIALAAGALAASAAFASGTPPEKLPVPAASVGAASGGVTTPGGGTRYRARSSGGGTVVERLLHGRGAGSVRLRGAFVVPAVTLAGKPDGLSADGATLALVGAGRTFPRAETSLAVLDARTLRVRRYVRLRGDFSFDAISPDGSRLYLIDYTSRTDPTEYAVRAYDVAAGRLLPKPIVDPSERDSDEMGGYPVSRVRSPDSRWDYTLYSAPGRKPFVHALDTVGGRARCLDLPGVAPGSLRHGSLSLGAGGGRLTVGGPHGSPVALIDTASLEVAEPGQGHPAVPAAAPRGGASSLPWVLIGLGAGLALAVAWLWGVPRLHRRRLAREG